MDIIIENIAPIGIFILFFISLILWNKKSKKKRERERKIEARRVTARKRNEKEEAAYQRRMLERYRPYLGRKFQAIIDDISSDQSMSHAEFINAVNAVCSDTHNMRSELDELRIPFGELIDKMMKYSDAGILSEEHRELLFNYRPDFKNFNFGEKIDGPQGWSLFEKAEILFNETSERRSLFDEKLKKAMEEASEILKVSGKLENDEGKTFDALYASLAQKKCGEYVANKKSWELFVEIEDVYKENIHLYLD